MQRRRPCPFRHPRTQKSPTANRQGAFTESGIRPEKGSKYQPTVRPTEYRCYIEEGIPYATAGAVTPSWNAFLRPSGNSPSQQHLTQGLLLCSRINIHHIAAKVNRQMSKISTLRRAQACLRRAAAVSAVSPFLRGVREAAPYGPFSNSLSSRVPPHMSS